MEITEFDKIVDSMKKDLDNRFHGPRTGIHEKNLIISEKQGVDALAKRVHDFYNK